VPEDIAVFGEVGLTGEVRPVGQPEARAREAVNLGFSRILLPAENHERVQKANIIANIRRESATPLQLMKAKHLSGAAQMILK